LIDEKTLRAVFEHALDAIIILDLDGRILDANPAVESVLGVARDELIGRRAEDLAPPHRQAMLVEIRRTLREQRRIRAKYEFDAADGERRWLEFTASAEVLPGRDLTIVRDCTHNERIQAALEAQSAQKVAIADLGMVALRGVTIEALTREAVSRVAATLTVAHAAILERPESGGPPQLRAGVGWRAGDPVLTAAPSRVSVPIRCREREWGSLEVRDARTAFDQEDVEFLRAIAGTLGLAIDGAQREEELRRRSGEVQQLAAATLAAEDRARELISQQLHDDLLQSLFVIRQDLAALAASDAAGADVLARARDGVAAAIQSLRSAVFDLHPVVLERGGLRAAVGAVAHHHAELGGLRIDTRVEPDVDGEHDRLLLSLTRELLANVTEHAGARNATVAMWRDGAEVVLEVVDDGCGMDPERARRAFAEGHIGLASVTQRVEALDGRLDLLRRPGGGTIVRAVLPARSEGA
jgi:PAS domain S-box-containing protein